jgi:hypothetical protein
MFQTIAQLKEWPAFGFGGGDVEGVVEGSVCRPHAQIRIQHEEGGPDRGDNGLGVFMRPLEGVDIHGHHDRAVDLVLPRLVGSDPQKVPAPLTVLDLALPDAERLDRVGEQAVQIGDGQTELDVPYRSTQIRRNQVEHLVSVQGFHKMLGS